VHKLLCQISLPKMLKLVHFYCVSLRNKKHLKNVGPIRYCEPPLHCQSPGVASRTAAIAIAQATCDVHNDDNDDDHDNDNNNDDNDNA